MTKTSDTRIPLSDISVSRRPSASIAVVGSPNAGKSTLFNRLTGLRQRIGNYPGVTVEKHIGTLKSDNKTIELVDLPGTHGLSAHSFEEQIAIDVIFGRMEGSQPPDAILAVVDATNLYQGLYLVQQLLDLERPIVVALTMSDAAKTSGIVIDVDALVERLNGITVCQVVATTGQGINELRNALVDLADQPAPKPTTAWPELTNAARELSFAKGQMIFFENDPCDGFYIILSGSVKIYKMSPGGREQILHTFKGGDTFAEVPAFDDGLCPANAQAVEDGAAEGPGLVGQDG